MQRYFSNNRENNYLILKESDLHHIKNVMRNKIDDEIEVIYENVVYICRIKNIDPLSLEIIKTINEDRDLNIELSIAISLVNEQKMDLILQKLTELGVTNIIPIKTERSIVRLDDKKEIKKIARWQTICKEASEQSKRTIIPTVNDIITLKELLTIPVDRKLICSLNELTKPINNYLTKDINSILFVIGPEGGFTDKEEQFLLDNNFSPVSLGKRVMRVETAAMYVASIINYIYEG